MKYKQVIIIRSDLKIGKGKLAAQAAHASLGAYKIANKKICKKWERGGAKKVVLKVSNLKELKKIYEKAKKFKLPAFLVKDSGLTQLRKGTITCLGIGPAKDEDIDKICGNLKLL